MVWGGDLICVFPIWSVRYSLYNLMNDSAIPLVWNTTFKVLYVSISGVYILLYWLVCTHFYINNRLFLIIIIFILFNVHKISQNVTLFFSMIYGKIHEQCENTKNCWLKFSHSPFIFIIILLVLIKIIYLFNTECLSKLENRK